MLYKKVKRKDTFKDDPEVITRSASKDDYKGTGYQRGHLLPCRHMQFSCRAMAETFYFSNVSPQDEAMNEQFMQYLEEAERNWVFEFGALFIVTGPIFGENPITIGENEVSVPDAFFKVYITPDRDDPQCLGMIIPNEELPDRNFEEYYYTVKEIEAATGMDFFAVFDDELEQKMESETDPALWVANTTRAKQVHIYQPAECDAGVFQDDKICINSAELWELETLPDIGGAKAQNIIEARPFKKIKDLKKVSGIGDATYRKIERLVSL